MKKTWKIFTCAAIVAASILTAAGMQMTKNKRILIDDFEDYTAGQSIDNVATPDGGNWNDWNALCSAHGTHAVYTFAESSGRALFTRSVGEAATSNPICTFGTPLSTAGSYHEYTWRFTAIPATGNQKLIIYSQTAGGTTLMYVEIMWGSYLRIWNNLTETTLIDNAVTATDYVIRIYQVDNATWYMTLNRTRYPTTGVYTNYDAATGYVGRIMVTGSNDAIGTASIDDIYTGHASAADGLQSAVMRYLGEVASKHADARWPPLPLSNGNLLAWSNDNKVYTLSGSAFTTWTVACSLAYSAIFIEPVAGTVYMAVTNDSAGVTTFYKSTDTGATWNDWGTWGADAAGDDTDNRIIVDMFYAGGVVYAVACGVNTLAIAADPGANAAWTAHDTETIVLASLSDIPFAKGFVSGSDYCCAMADNGDATFFTWTHDTITQRAVMTADYSVDNHSSVLFDSGTTWTTASAGVAWVVCSDLANTWKLYKTSDGGANWAIDVASLADGRTSTNPCTYKRSGYYQYMMTHEPAVGTVIYRLDTNLHHFERVATLTDDFPWGAYETCITDVPVALAEDAGGNCEIWSRVIAAASELVDVHGYQNIFAGASMASHCEFATINSNNDLFTVGDIVELYDAWSTLWFKGRITSKDVGKGITSFTATGPDAEAGQPYTGADFTAAKLSAMMDTAIDLFKRGYVGNIQDINTASTFNYNLTNHVSVQPLFRLQRGMDRAVIWMTPAGAWYIDHFDDLDSTGLRINESNTQWSLLENIAATPDNRCTRATVLASHLEATGRARVSYTGNASREVTEGIVPATEYDEQFMDHGDADHLATNLCNIFSTATTFVHFIVVNHGFLQPGKTISVSWNRGDTVVAKTTMLILAVHANMKLDIQEVVASNNIVLEGEYESMELLDEQNGATKGGTMIVGSPGKIQYNTK